MPARPQTVVFIDDAHTFGGAQIALAWMIYVVVHRMQLPVLCICTPRTQTAIERIAGPHPALTFLPAPPALPLNLFRSPVRVPAWLRLLRQVRARGVRSWWLNLPDLEFGLAPLLALRALGIVPCAYLHGTAHFSAFYRDASWRRRWLSRVRDVVADWMTPRLHRVLATASDASRAELAARLPAICGVRTLTLYPPAPELPTPTPGARIDPATDVLSLWVIGNMVQGHKNQRAAVETLKELLGRGLRAHLTVAGTGPDLAALEHYARALGVAPHVTWAGWLADVWSATPADAIVLVPSFHETLSLVAREALARGLCLVVSPLPVFREWVPPGSIAPSLNPADLADTVLSIAGADPAVRVQQGCYALERFSYRAFARDFAALLDESSPG